MQWLLSCVHVSNSRVVGNMQVEYKVECVEVKNYWFIGVSVVKVK